MVSVSSVHPYKTEEGSEVAGEDFKAYCLRIRSGLDIFSDPILAQQAQVQSRKSNMISVFADHPLRRYVIAVELFPIEIIMLCITG
jgi:hypothetical protein